MRIFELCKCRVYELFEASGKKGKIKSSKAELVWDSFYGNTFIKIYFNPNLVVEFYDELTEQSVTYAISKIGDINKYLPSIEKNKNIKFKLGSEDARTGDYGMILHNACKTFGFPIEILFGEFCVGATPKTAFEGN